MNICKRGASENLKLTVNKPKRLETQTPDMSHDGLMDYTKLTFNSTVSNIACKLFPKMVNNKI